MPPRFTSSFARTQLARGVDLGLDRGLRLAEHRCGVERLPPRAGEQVSGTQQDGRAVVERHRAPRRGGLTGRAQGVLGVLLCRAGQRAEDRTVVVRLDDVEALSATHALLATDGHRQLERLLLQLGQLRLQFGALRGAGGVLQDRLVDRGGNLGDRVHAQLLLGLSVPEP
jgi:hypothetical protein